MPTVLQNNYNATIEVWNNGKSKAGQRLTITNRKVDTLSFYLSKSGTPPGQIQWQIFKLTGTVPGTQIDSVVFMNCADVTTTPILYTATMSGIAVNEEVRICVAPTTLDNTNKLLVSYQNTDVKASEYETDTLGGAWTNNTGWDCAYQYTYTEVITTQSVTAISGTTATGNGTLNTITGATDHGHCWKVYVSAASPPTTANSLTTNGVPAATGAFTSAITGLTAGTKYGVRAYVIISGTTFYGNQVFFWAAKGTVAPFDAVTRVNTYTRSFWAGEDGQHGVGQMVVQTGGVYSTFIPPVGARQPASAFPQPEVPRHKTFKEYSNAELTAALGLSYATYAQWVNQMGPFNLQKVYGHVPTYEEYVNIMVAQFRAGAK